MAPAAPVLDLPFRPVTLQFPSPKRWGLLTHLLLWDLATRLALIRETLDVIVQGEAFKKYWSVFPNSFEPLASPWKYAQTTLLDGCEKDSSRGHPRPSSSCQHRLWAKVNVCCCIPPKFCDGLLHSNNQLITVHLLKILVASTEMVNKFLHCKPHLYCS